MIEYTSGNIYIRQGVLEAGEVAPGHAHNFDHTTYVAKGRILIERLAADGSVERAVEKDAAQGYNWVLIKAGVRHRLTALEPAIYHCIYSHRSAQAPNDVVQEYDGWAPGYA